MIQAINLQKAYSGTTVLDLPEFKIENGEVFGLVGNNGAGKTTFFSLVLDLIRATRGKILINEIAVAKSEDWKAHTGAYIDESFTIGYLTPDEYFSFIGELRQMNENDISTFLDSFKEFFNDEIVGKKKFIRDLSKGNQKKVGVVGALMGYPELVVLDEPFANLDPSSQFKFRKIIKEIAAERNQTFLISSHDLDNITDVCERIVILEKGKIVKDVQKTESTLAELEEFFTGVKAKTSFHDEL
ncbi:MAG: ABC transporter ATP-binding protein [Prolixibacteraceae bacterium]|jgi:ABC-2 type transport system ATP-binding protein|nr:ABC transporter ATP-binding protein [Prolixibacteraceae bacterium]MBT6007254.1 ABC transporter ATP-binding protein [Prolixibacteraceae bacterium]MBT6763832.1 ABC transporter ATP-binding protein [Prolixibacteraceae bacterium]MBT6998893.1 ABC transporter ATP-binding protein [Prolixibacteraceae bacterium]MBT7394673.1 ABC transporter ATP-binding protein [Prolixibacteraceae bacterium]